MLNSQNVRELAYLVNVDAIEPIVGSDNCEAAVIGAWRVMVRKNTFKAGDLAVYFEIDSKVPETETYDFLERKHYMIKTQKYTFGGKGNFISQGLIMAISDFVGWEIQNDGVMDNAGGFHTLKDDSRFLTKVLDVTYSSAEDNVRKAKSPDKYKKMAQRNGKLFSHQPFRFLMKYAWGRKLLFTFFGKKRDKTGWPAWVQKTDEERVQNMPWILTTEPYWIATEKIDGTSTTFTMHRKKFGKYDFFVCSRNVCFTKDKNTCFYDKNYYTQMAEKYDIEAKMRLYMKFHPEYEWITIQGETFGSGIQKRDYSMKGQEFLGFNFITSKDGRWNSVAAAKECFDCFGIGWVPIVDEHFVMPNTVDELLAIATDESVLDHGMREGFVFRSHDGKKSFKAVSNEFLLKYHQ